MQETTPDNLVKLPLPKRFAYRDQCGEQGPCRILDEMLANPYSPFRLHSDHEYTTEQQSIIVMSGSTAFPLFYCPFCGGKLPIGESQCDFYDL